MGGQKIKNREFKKYYLEPKKYINIAVNSNEDLLIVRFGNNETDKEKEVIQFIKIVLRWKILKKL